MDTMLVGSQCPMYCNVRIRTRNEKTGKITSERCAKNRVTKLALLGIVRFLNGEFNDTTPDRIYEYIPRYLALGTNEPSIFSTGVTKNVTVNDSHLLSEITESSVNGSKESVRRVWIAQRNHNKITSRFSDPFIKLSIGCYISSNNYDGQKISEAGLFTKETGNNCWARVTFDPIIKHNGEVLDITWEITVLSYGTTIYPDSIRLDDTDELVLGLNYTIYHLGKLIYDGNIEHLTDSQYYIYDNKIYDRKNKCNQVAYIKPKQVTKGSTIYENRIYKSSDNSETEYVILDSGEITESGVATGFSVYSEYSIMIDSKTYDQTDMKAFRRKLPDDTENIYYIYKTDSSGTETLTNYRINSKNKFEKRPRSDSQKYEEIVPPYYVYLDKYITDENGAPTGYEFDLSGNIIKLEETSMSTTDTGYYVNSSGVIYSNAETTGTSINENNDLITNNTSTGYHVANDGYIAESRVYKLSPTITPSNATDRSIVWVSSSDEIATVNFDGIITSRNLGNCVITGITNNGLKAKCSVTVEKSSNIIEVESLTLDKTSINFTLNSSNSDKSEDNIKTMSETVTAIVYPPYSTNTSVKFSSDAQARDLIKVSNIEGNKCLIEYIGAGAIGRGYVICRSSNGLTAKCLVTVSYKSEEGGDCQ